MERLPERQSAPLVTRRTVLLAGIYGICLGASGHARRALKASEDDAVIPALERRTPAIIRLDDGEEREDIFTPLLNGDTVTIGGRYLQLHRTRDGKATIGTGYCDFERKPQRGRLFAFSHPPIQAEFERYVNKTSPYMGKVGYVHAVRLAQALKLHDATPQQMASMHVKIDNPLLQLIKKDEFFIPQKILGNILGSLANLHPDINEADVNVMVFAPNGKFFHLCVKMEHVGECAPRR
jgi:hypothetical protein